MGALLIGGLAPTAQADAPHPVRALRALLGVPLAALGDGAAAAGLLGAAGVALAGDAVSALDANRVTGPVLEGRLSGAIRALAWSLSQAGTGTFEALHGADVERWPEPAAAYLLAAPGTGRFDTAIGGLSALALLPWDIAGGLALVPLHGSGASALAADLETALADARSAYVGPPPAPPRLAREAALREAALREAAE